MKTINLIICCYIKKCINVSFNNNSNVPIDVIIFTFYSDQLTIDVETGIVTK